MRAQITRKLNGIAFIRLLDEIFIDFSLDEDSEDIELDPGIASIAGEEVRNRHCEWKNSVVSITTIDATLSHM